MWYEARKNHLVGQILYRSLDPSKKRRQETYVTRLKDRWNYYCIRLDTLLSSPYLYCLWNCDRHVKKLTDLLHIFGVGKFCDSQTHFAVSSKYKIPSSIADWENGSDVDVALFESLTYIDFKRKKYSGKNFGNSATFM